MYALNEFSNSHRLHIRTNIDILAELVRTNPRLQEELLIVIASL